MGLRTRLRLMTKAAVGTFDESSAKQAWGLLSGVLPGDVGTPPARGTREYLRAYSEMPWLRAVASRVATAVAAAEWQLYIKGKPGKGRRDFALQRSNDHAHRKALMETARLHDDLRQIEEHPLLDLMHSANSLQTGQQMRKVTQLHIDLTGEAFWLKERDALGTVVGVWPIPPDWVINTPTPVTRRFRVSFRGWRGEIPDTEMLWMSDPDPSNPYARGTGSVQALADELETDEYAAKHMKAFFYNRARPDLLVWPKTGVMRPEAVARFEEEWLGQSQGFWKAFKPYFLTREVGVKELDQNFRSLEIVKIREQERNTVIQQFGMPPELLGVIENSNRATINAADYLMSRYVVQPRLEFIRAVLQERLVPEYDERLILDYVSPVQRDEEAQLKAAIAAPWAQSVDEWREMQGRAKLDGGKGEVHVFSGTQKEHTMGEEPEPVAPVDPSTGLPLAPGRPPATPDDRDDDERAFAEWHRLSRDLMREDR